jgi:UDP-N-acetylmuramoyl-L-alanyl-D-glutamate--2,6-diaminopimelate ligase
MALEKGAAAVLCQRAPETAGPYVVTPDSRRALALASAAYFDHPADKLCMIGVTGTNGKTTSTILIKHLLEDSLGAKVGLVGTISNWIGDRELHTERTTPESYELQKLLHEMVQAGCTHAVMEVSSHALCLDRVEGIHFQVGLFTNLTQDHLDFHKTMEAYGEAKARLFSICDKGAVNLDDEWAEFMRQRAKCPVLGFGLDDHSGQLYAQDVTYTASGVTFTAVEPGQSAQIHLAIPGRFSVSNALTVLAAARLLDIPLPDAAQSLGRAKGVKGRVEVVPTGRDFTMIIDYAHTPDALEKVLQALRAVTQGRLVALFGCGGDRDGTKRPIMGRIAAENADFTIVTSDNPRTEDPETIIAQIVAGMPSEVPKEVITDRPTAIAWAMDHHQPGDVILLAGKGHETYQDVGGTKHHMDEREIVAAHLQKMGGPAL